MYGFSFQRMMDALIFDGCPFHHGLYRQSIWMPFALNGRSEIGSGMEQVGSGLNGRRRNGADFRTPVECAAV